MKNQIKKQITKENAVLIAIFNRQQTKDKVNEYLEELKFLASTLNITTIKKFIQRVNVPDPKLYIGKGKAEEIRQFVLSHDINLVIFDDDLSPSQLRNLERIMKCRIYDRSLLILDIFLKRAKTAQAKTQVELARYQYLMPRLTRMWTHLERQRGGTGTRGGAGEKEIETDRRVIRNQIGVLKKRLKKINTQNATQRKSRSNIVRVALVGYTNVGKSTLMTLLSKAKMYAEDELFATVDSTVRKVVINSIPFLLSDTVGFIRKLPHHLIESFKSTLDEVAESDILLHVVDVSHPSFHDQIDIVNQTLSDIGAVEKDVLYVYNKVDKLDSNPEYVDTEGRFSLDKFQEQNIVGKSGEDRVYISASEKININVLRDMLFKKIKAKHCTIYPNYIDHVIH